MAHLLHESLTALLVSIKDNNFHGYVAFMRSLSASFDPIDDAFQLDLGALASALVPDLAGDEAGGLHPGMQHKDPCLEHWIQLYNRVTSVEAKNDLLAHLEYQLEIHLEDLRVPLEPIKTLDPRLAIVVDHRSLRLAWERVSHSQAISPTPVLASTDRSEHLGTAVSALHQTLKTCPSDHRPWILDYLVRGCLQPDAYELLHMAYHLSLASLEPDWRCGMAHLLTAQAIHERTALKDNAMLPVLLTCIPDTLARPAWGHTRLHANARIASTIRSEQPQLAASRVSSVLDALWGGAALSALSLGAFLWYIHAGTPVLTLVSQLWAAHSVAVVAGVEGLLLLTALWAVNSRARNRVAAIKPLVLPELPPEAMKGRVRARTPLLMDGEHVLLARAPSPTASLTDSEGGRPRSDEVEGAEGRETPMVSSSLPVPAAALRTPLPNSPPAIPSDGAGEQSGGAVAPPALGDSPAREGAGSASGLPEGMTLVRHGEFEGDLDVGGVAVDPALLAGLWAAPRADGAAPPRRNGGGDERTATPRSAASFVGSVVGSEWGESEGSGSESDDDIVRFT